jgi:hypothetical protein
LASKSSSNTIKTRKSEGKTRDVLRPIKRLPKEKRPNVKNRRNLTEDKPRPIDKQKRPNNEKSRPNKQPSNKLKRKRLKESKIEWPKKPRINLTERCMSVRQWT